MSVINSTYLGAREVIPAAKLCTSAMKSVWVGGAAKRAGGSHGQTSS